MSEDKQLRAVHLIMDFEPISEIYQEVGHAIKAGDQRLAQIDVSHLRLIVVRVDPSSEEEEEEMDLKKGTT